MLRKHKITVLWCKGYREGGKMTYSNEQRLQAALENINSPFELKIAAAKAIFRVSGKQGFDALLRLVENGSEDHTALKWLVSFKWPSALDTSAAVPILEQRMEEASDAAAQWFALKGLYRFSAEPNRSFYKRMLADYLLDEDVQLRIYAVSFFVSNPEPSIIPLLALLLDDENKLLSSLSQTALRNLKSPAARFALREWKR
jgi:HEAT repeat protein